MSTSIRRDSLELVSCKITSVTAFTSRLPSVRRLILAQQGSWWVALSWSIPEVQLMLGASLCFLTRAWFIKWSEWHSVTDQAPQYLVFHWSGCGLQTLSGSVQMQLLVILVRKILRWLTEVSSGDQVARYWSFKMCSSFLVIYFSNNDVTVSCSSLHRVRSERGQQWHLRLAAVCMHPPDDI